MDGSLIGGGCEEEAGFAGDMKVYLTIDVECYSGDYDAEVYGEGLGLPFILESCNRHGLPATFFVESLGATRWGGAGVRRICHDLNGNQQDIQLHLHPSVARIDGIKDCRDVIRDLEVGMQVSSRLASPSCGIMALRMLLPSGQGIWLRIPLRSAPWNRPESILDQIVILMESVPSVRD